MNEQPRFDGPGIYGIVAYQQPGYCCNSWGGGKDPNEPVKFFPVGGRQFTENELWQFALATSGGEEATYILLNVRNGYYLAVKDDKTIYCSNKTPTDKGALWTISDVSRESNGYHVFQVKSAMGGQLTAANGYSSGAQLILGGSSRDDNTKFYIVTRTPG